MSYELRVYVHVSLEKKTQRASSKKRDLCGDEKEISRQRKAGKRVKIFKNVLIFTNISTRECAGSRFLGAVQIFFLVLREVFPRAL